MLILTCSNSCFIISYRICRHWSHLRLRHGWHGHGLLRHGGHRHRWLGHCRLWQWRLGHRRHRHCRLRHGRLAHSLHTTHCSKSVLLSRHTSHSSHGRIRLGRWSTTERTHDASHLIFCWDFGWRLSRGVCKKSWKSCFHIFLPKAPARSSRPFPEGADSVVGVSGTALKI